MHCAQCDIIEKNINLLTVTAKLKAYTFLCLVDALHQF